MEKEISELEIKLFETLEKIDMQEEFVSGVTEDCCDDEGRLEMLEFLKKNPTATKGIIIAKALMIKQKKEYYD